MRKSDFVRHLLEVARLVVKDRDSGRQPDVAVAEVYARSRNIYIPGRGLNRQNPVLETIMSIYRASERSNQTGLSPIGCVKLLQEVESAWEYYEEASKPQVSRKDD
jgi:hypothetical protein